MKNIFLIFSLLVLFTQTIAPALATPEKYYFLVVPQSDVPPAWRPLPNGEFPILNTDFLMKLIEESSFIEGIAAFRPQFVEVGNRFEDKVRVLNYCFNRENFIMDELKTKLIEGQGDTVLFSDRLLKRLGLDKLDLPFKIIKFVELFDPSSKNHTEIKKDSRKYVNEEIVVSGIIPQYLKLNKSGEYMLTNNCILPLNKSHAKKLQFETEYSMPPTLLIKSLSSDVNDFDDLMLKLSNFHGNSRPGLRFHIRVVSE